MLLYVCMDVNIEHPKSTGQQSSEGCAVSPLSRAEQSKGDSTHTYINVSAMYSELTHNVGEGWR